VKVLRRHLPKTLVALVAAACIAALTMAPVGGAAGPPPCATNCATLIAPPYPAAPFGVTSGPLGSEWFSLDHAVARIDQQGQITTYPVSDPNEQDVGWMTRGPDGSVWFAERDTGKIGRIDPNGSMREYPLPSPDAGPQGIVFAPDGNVYVTEQGSNAIARLNPVTGTATDIPVPTPNSTTQSGALGPDGAIWFIERAAAKVGRMTLNGQFTEYPLAPGAFPNRIVVGPDGALWFTELRANKVGRITTDGQLTEYPVDGGPVGITVGKDGQLYTVLNNLFAPSTADAVVRLDLGGQVTGEWPLPGAGGPLLIATGFGLDLWVTDTFGGNVYRVTPYDVGR
jgi:virginiamycin B lyase